MLDLEKPTIVTILDVMVLGSMDSECQPTVIMSVSDKYGAKRRIFLHNHHEYTSLRVGDKILVQEQKNKQCRMTKEYKVLQYIRACNQM